MASNSLLIMVAEVAKRFHSLIQQENHKNCLYSWPKRNSSLLKMKILFLFTLCYVCPNPCAVVLICGTQKDNSEVIFHATVHSDHICQTKHIIKEVHMPSEVIN